MADSPRNNPPKRILVLGSFPHTRLVDAYPWDNLPPRLNVADYDVAILNFVPLENPRLATGINPDTLPRWEQFARLIFSKGSETIAIGIPGRHMGSNPYLEVEYWLPGFPHITYEEGEDIREIVAEFGFYFDRVKKWYFHASPKIEARSLPEFVERYVTIADHAGGNISGTIRMLAQTRFHTGIGFELTFQTWKRIQVRSGYGEEYRDQIGRKSGRVIWLPPTTELRDYEAIDLILRQRYGLRFERATPAWVEKYKLPSQIPIQEEVVQLQTEVDQTEARLKDAKDRLTRTLLFQSLLFEQGDDVLEPLVRKTLGDLGAAITEPERKGREDGRIVDPSGRKGILEIKGRTGSLRLEDIRQLHQWSSDAVAYEGWEGKAILISNLQCELDPAKRKSIYPPDCIRAAKQFGICLVTTTQLFRALVSHQRGELDLAGFWDAIFSSIGPCSLPELVE